MGSSPFLKHVYNVTENKTSASNRNFIKLGYVELRKHTGDERNWEIGMAEGGIKINNIARLFDIIHKTTAYPKIDCYWQTGFAGESPKSDKPKKLTPLAERFIHISQRWERFLPA